MAARRRRFRIPNPVTSTREVLSIVRELSFEELRTSAETYPRVAVIARTVEEARRSAEEVFGYEARSRVVTLSHDDEWPERAELVLVERRADPRVPRYARVVRFGADDPVDRTRKAMYRGEDDIELRLGREFPALRESASAHVIDTTSMANAQFALVSNIPALVPVVGGVLAAGADTIVLTKNQLMMIFKLAAIHGRDLDQKRRIYVEMTPVVGAGLFWRTVARELAALLPFAAGTVPKVAIAFAGTYAAGMAAHVYYMEGKRASAARMRQYYREALDTLRERQIPLPRRGRDDVLNVRALPPPDAYTVESSEPMP